jgi:electron transfer flavoprotein alpha/beta subunit
MKAKKKKIETLKPEDLGLDFVRVLLSLPASLTDIVSRPRLMRADTPAHPPRRSTPHGSVARAGVHRSTIA